jgi:hypothetical protein
MQKGAKWDINSYLHPHPTAALRVYFINGNDFSEEWATLVLPLPLIWKEYNRRAPEDEGVL